MKKKTHLVLKGRDEGGFLCGLLAELLDPDGKGFKVQLPLGIFLLELGQMASHLGELFKELVLFAGQLRNGTLESVDLLFLAGVHKSSVFQQDGLFLQDLFLLVQLLFEGEKEKEKESTGEVMGDGRLAAHEQKESKSG